MVPLDAVKSANDVSESVSTQTGRSICMVKVSGLRPCLSCVKCIVFPMKGVTASVTFVFDKKAF